MMQHIQNLHNLEEALLNVSEFGEYPILCDTSPCTKKMMESFSHKLSYL
jgi:D-lactate dehydrogenase